MQITSTNLEILDIPRGRTFPAVRPLKFYSKHQYYLSCTLTENKKFISEIIGFLGYEIKEATCIKHMQAIVTDLSNYFLKRIESEMEASSAYDLITFGSFFEDGSTKPDADMIRNLCLALFDQAHELVYGQQIPNLLTSLQEELTTYLELKK